LSVFQGDAGSSHEARGMPQSASAKILHEQQLPKGTAGKSIDLIANFYKLTTSDAKVFHYDVVIRQVQE